ncbi:beta-galactosidase 6 isoform X2 [Tripterygium wilfordii]|uniref:Beta-galactosidase 6 isoform X2 n=1 Tax=Tripterygium wilfordii TaxID=458696 RepID=A0A7J7DFA8_TRIWF|nr:beta-galactosidase 6 isoform X2 [Tripterygium wilfordii]
MAYGGLDIVRLMIVCYICCEDVVILDSPKLRMEDWTLFRVMCSGTSTSHSLVSMISLVRGRYDLVRFIKETQAQGLYVCLRIGPFIETLRVNGITGKSQQLLNNF